MSASLDDLVRYREVIDAIDLDLLRLLNKRTEAVEQIGRVKQALDLAIYEPKREDAVFENVAGHNEGPLQQDAVKRIFERIIDEMRTVQRIRILDHSQER